MAAKLEEISSRVRPGLRSDAVPLGEWSSSLLHETEAQVRDDIYLVYKY